MKHILEPRLSPIQRHELDSFVRTVCRVASTWVGVVLVDGQALLGILPSHRPISRDRLVLRGVRTMMWVPIKSIAGLYSFGVDGDPRLIDQQLSRYAHHAGVNASGLVARSGLPTVPGRALEAAERLVTEVASSLLGLVWTQFRVPVDSTGIRFEPPEFLTDTPLYADWDYAATHSGGIRDVSINILVAGAGFGWDRPLWRWVRKQLERNDTPLEFACHSEPDVSLTAYITVLTAREGYYSKQIEGMTWIGAIASAQPFDGSTFPGSWALVFFREDGLTLPAEVWENLTQPIRIYGEIVRLKTMTPFGAGSCIMKVRAAAYLAPST